MTKLHVTVNVTYLIFLAEFQVLCKYLKLLESTAMKV